MMQKNRQTTGAICLLTTAIVWGIAFVAQSAGNRTGSFTFNTVRMLLAGALLIPAILILDRRTERKLTAEEITARRKQGKQDIRSGMLLGVILFVASNLQQFAFLGTSAGKVAFITTMYMFFTPLIGLLIGKRISKRIWFCICMGFIGMFFLCVDPSDMTAVNFGDMLALGCAVVFAIHTLLIERFTSDADGLKLSAAQFITVGVLGIVPMFVFENPSWEVLSTAVVPILYAAIMACDVGYVLQIVGQRYVEATVSTLLMSMESVFAVLAAALLLGEHLKGRELLGCAIMFTAVILAQLGESRRNRRE